MYYMYIYIYITIRLEHRQMYGARSPQIGAFEPVCCNASPKHPSSEPKNLQDNHEPPLGYTQETSQATLPCILRKRSSRGG